MTEPPPPDQAAPQKRWKRHFERGTPKGAMTWKSAPQRSRCMFAWQCAVMEKFSTSARVLRVAWLLYALCLKEGYAFATDSYISKTLGIQLNNLQAALAELEKAGAIVRASCFVDGKPQRRIWPSAQIIPLVTGGAIPLTATGMDARDIPLTARGIHTPHGETRDTPHGKGTDSKGKRPTQKTVRISTTADAARRDAERREKRLLPTSEVEVTE